jgi:Flp pilus assembly protein TadG
VKRNRGGRGHQWATHRARNERGIAVVDYAIVLPLLIVLVFGIVEMSITYNRQNGLHAAALEGARAASQPHATTSDVVRRVRTALRGVLSNHDIQNAVVTVTPDTAQPCSQQPPGSHVVVTVSAPDQLSIPLFAHESLTLMGRGELPCE